jgi:LPXTG-motif cell wall-anchored protein
VGVFAETAEKDGLEITFDVGDKEIYEVGEEIPISLIIANYNNFDVEGVSIEKSLPEGFDWIEGSFEIPERFGADGVINAGDTITISGKAVKKLIETTTTTTESTTTTAKTTDKTTAKTTNKTTDSTTTSASTSSSSSSLSTSTSTGTSQITSAANTTTTRRYIVNQVETTTTTNKNDSTAPKTGDNFNVLWLILGVLGLGGSIFFIAKGKKNGTKFTAILLCISLLGTSFGYTGVSEISAEELESLTVSDTVTVENSDYTFTVTVKYKSFAAEEIKLTGSTMDIECGEGTETVYFYAEYGGNVDNLMLESDGEIVELMYDNGENGDETAGDNVYTCTLEIDKTTPYEEIVWYYAVSETGLSSDGWQIFLYELPTEEDLILEETVSNAFVDLTGSEEFLLADIEQRKEMVETLLDEMVAQGYIDEASIEYNENMGWYEYVDTGAKYQHMVTVKDNNGTASVGVDIYYGAQDDIAGWREFTIETARYTADAMGASTMSDEDVTVRDIYNLGNTDSKILYISAHGGYDYHNRRNQGGWVIDEAVNGTTDSNFKGSLGAKKIGVKNKTPIIWRFSLSIFGN